MASVLDISPFDGGWCLKIADTGELLFFPARRRALARAKTLARSWPCAVEVRVRARRRSPQEAWAPMANPDPYPLGAPA